LLQLSCIYVYLPLMMGKINWDALGVTASVACAIHCAVLPLLLTSLPVFGFDIIQNVLFEYGMILLAFLVGVYALSHGFRKHHHRFLPLTMFSVGILFLLAKQIWHTMHLWLLVPAVIAIISAHYLNYRFCRTHNQAHAEDCVH
jgi:MerC mercury resistance protein